jgi:hypothetical protein
VRDAVRLLFAVTVGAGERVALLLPQKLRDAEGVSCALSVPKALPVGG